MLEPILASMLEPLLDKLYLFVCCFPSGKIGIQREHLEGKVSEKGSSHLVEPMGENKCPPPKKKALSNITNRIWELLLEQGCPTFFNVGHFQI